MNSSHRSIKISHSARVLLDHEDYHIVMSLGPWILHSGIIRNKVKVRGKRCTRMLEVISRNIGYWVEPISKPSTGIHDYRRCNLRNIFAVNTINGDYKP